MKLLDIANRFESVELVGAEGADGLEITRVTSDSRDVQEGDLFVAVKGLRVDGHDFVATAIESGAAAVALERAVPGVEVPVLSVADGVTFLGEVAAALAGDPAKALRLVGITGTNGKTTTSFLVESMIEAARRKVGAIGTVSYRFAGASVAAPYTTPTPELLHRTFAEMVEKSIDDVVLEVSSIALSMGRLAGTVFDVAAFTNLTQDHLDIHGDMETYRAAKQTLFSDYLAPNGVAVINVDDDDGEAMLAAARKSGQRRIIRVSAAGAGAEEIAAEAEVRVLESVSSIKGITATIETPRGTIDVASKALLGAYNIANIALAVGIAEALDLGLEAMSAGIASMVGVPGRVERVANDQGLDILVDYAHTPDALANVLAALKPLCAGRLICVFGCGGDRDAAKRPLMGAAAASMADLVIVTSDNPRTEDPHAIIDMILPAVPSPFFVDAERAVAIRAAVLEATRGDIVLIAGKGHEDYQILGDTKIQFDDRAHAAAAAGDRRSWALRDVATATRGSVLGDGDTRIERVVIDGRQTAPGDLYVAIRGERLNGHDFVDQALKSGASALLVERGTVLPPEVSRVAVDDTRVALGEFARQVRRDWGRPVVAVTGSAGKTTTKDLIAAATRSLHPLATRGSLNNETGVPLTLLGLQAYHSLAIVEMGMRGLTQIDYLCGIAEPDIGVVVNAGVAHVGVIGSEADIVRGKAEVYGRLPESGVAIYPADDERLARFALAAPNRMSFGAADHADVRLIDYRSRGALGSVLHVCALGDDHEVTIGLYGRHNALNATCALAVAITAGVSTDEAIAGLASSRPPGMRGETSRAGGRNLLIDCYNSNPHALEAALETVAELAAHSESSAYAVIGDMLELGDEASADHRAAGHTAVAKKVGVVAIGEHSDAVVEGARSEGDLDAVSAASPALAAEAVWNRSKPGDWLLFKASRGAKLERVVEAVRELAEGDEPSLRD